MGLTDPEGIKGGEEFFVQGKGGPSAVTKGTPPFAPVSVSCTVKTAPLDQTLFVMITSPCLAALCTELVGEYAK